MHRRGGELSQKQTREGREVLTVSERLIQNRSVSFQFCYFRMPTHIRYFNPAAPYQHHYDLMAV